MKISDCPYCGIQPNISYHPYLGCWHIACKNEVCSEQPSTWFYYVMDDAKDEWEDIVSAVRKDINATCL